MQMYDFNCAPRSESDGSGRAIFLGSGTLNKKWGWSGQRDGTRSVPARPNLRP